MAKGAIHALSVPTPFAIGPVNCYLVEDDPLTLVDVGPNSGTSLTTLETLMGELGHSVEDLQRIVITHQHMDHFGLAQILADRSGAEVCALGALVPWLADFPTAMGKDDHFSQAIMFRNGIPQDIVVALRTLSRLTQGWGASVRVDHPLVPGETLDFADRSWRIHHRPGHSPSDTIFHDEASGELLAGDHLLPRVSSNPIISRPLDGNGAGDGATPAPRPRALMTYLASMRATRELDVSVVFPGHGEPLTDHRTLIDDRLQQHERRAEKIAGLIAEHPSTAYEISQQMWGKVAVTQGYLTLSEVLGHVDLLLERGLVAQFEDDGVVTFATAG